MRSDVVRSRGGRWCHFRGTTAGYSGILIVQFMEIQTPGGRICAATLGVGRGCD